MPDEVNLTPEQGTETATVSEAPTDFREYATWRRTGELPEAKEAIPAAAGADAAQAAEPQAKTEPDSGTDDSQEAGDNDDEEDKSEGAPAGKRKGGSRQRYIDKLTRENEELKRLIAGREPVTPPHDKPSEPAQPVAAGKPKLENFKTLEEYQEALTDWKLDERERTRKEADARTAQEEAARTEQERWTAKEKAARKAHDDYDDLIDTVVIPAGPGVLAARQAMLEDEHGAELLYHLAKHPKELERIAALPPASAVLAIGKLSAKFDTPATETNGKPRITGAPKPPPPSGRPSKATPDSIDDPEVIKDFPRWERLRKAQLGR
jgi:hypothetical protein